MKEDIPEKIKKLAETLQKTGLAASEAEAIEKAKATLKAEELVSKTQNLDNYFVSQKDKTVKDMVKDETSESKAQGGGEPSVEDKETTDNIPPIEREKSKEKVKEPEHKEQVELDEDEDDIEIKEMNSLDDEESEDDFEDSDEE